MRPKSLQRALLSATAARKNGINFRRGGLVSALVLPLLLHGDGGLERRNVGIDQLVIAGWTGRDSAAVEKHIAELEALGVKRPATTPIFYRASAARLTIDDEIEVLGDASSGEAEFVLLQHAGRLWIGTGSDHTDREVEKYGVSVSKQMCDKPVAPEFWPAVEVAPHWDKLMLRSWVFENNLRTLYTEKRALYQEGPVTAMLDPLTLIQKFNGKAGLADGTLMFCGTLSAQGGVRPSDTFEFELEDPVLSRKIQHRYRVRRLPVLG
jgi:Protein of unknown function (DUF2848)